MATEKESNLKRLQDADVILKNASITSKQRDAIESLSKEEVDFLIRIREKTGSLDVYREGERAGICLL